ncbi:VTT domain-containing protein [Inquilinus sp. CAU 1745]|uniref:VTT domain-containing protein n=1 Tax=Inquilinus sp. CAU 1745 TaxID=3140369 RepID=UPI00325B6630
MSILEPGDSCWRVEHADRVALLIDGEAYFAALRSAIMQARKSIVILAWELHTKVELVRGAPPDDGWPVALGALLRRAVDENRDLQVRVLLWDYAVIYALERELFPRIRRPWDNRRRIVFRTDGHHPPTASHHQKLVVIDDNLAFCGGLDITANRWDTSDHRAADPRRTNPDGDRYEPFHDVQMMVDGDAARALGDLARDRWRRAAGRRFADWKSGDGDPWPVETVPDVRSVQVAIARTESPWRDRQEVREVEKAWVTAVEAARRHIYIENQYFTSGRVGDAIARRLDEEDGPEIVIVLPRRNNGWLEEETMGVGRDRLIRRLRRADRRDRLRICHPVLAGDHPPDLNIHAKVMVVDDRLMRVGSSNLSNRSMGLDTECDLLVEAGERPEVRQAIARFRDRLLAEHLDQTTDTVRETIAETGSLIETIGRLTGGGRRLEVFDEPAPETRDVMVPEFELIDPDRPVPPEQIAARLITPEDFESPDGQEPDEASRWRRLRRPIAILLAAAFLAAAWIWTPLSDYANPSAAIDWARGWQDATLAPLIVIGLFVLGGLVSFPVTVMISMVGVVFHPFWGSLYAFVGILLSASLLFFIGFALGRDAISRLSGRTFAAINDRLGRRGITTVAIIRMVPIAPFSLVNVAAGALRIRFRDFMIGTIMGMGPGTVALILLGDRFAAMIEDPTPRSITLLGAAILLLVALALATDHWLAKRR